MNKKNKMIKKKKIPVMRGEIIKEAKVMRKISTMGFVGMVFTILWANPVFSQISVNEKYLDTEGNAKGVAVKDYYIYLADGSGGLKIINMSYPAALVKIATLPLRGSSIEQVAVDEDMAVCTDAEHRQVHFVDVKNKSRPELRWTLDVEGDKPRAVVADRGQAFVVEFGDDPSVPEYFSGIEVFSYNETSAESIQLTEIEAVHDAVVTRRHIFVGGGNQLQVFRRTGSGMSSDPVLTHDFPLGEEINSLALYGGYLFVFGTDQLYAFSAITLYLPPEFLPMPPFLPHFPAPLFIFSLVNQIHISGNPEYRKVDAAILDKGDGETSDPYIYVLLTTLTSYGMVTFNRYTGEFSPFIFYDLTEERWVVLRDITEATEGKIKIYDSLFPEYFYPGFFKGGVMGIGAIGNYGLGWVYIEDIVL